MSERRKCKFNIELQNTYDMFESTDNEHEAYCKICKVVINITNKGRTSLEKHIFSEKHKTNSANAGCELPIIDPVYSSESEASDAGFNSTNDNPLENSSEVEVGYKKQSDNKPFSAFWLGKDWSKGWLAPYPEDRYKAKCLSCKKVLKAGKSELVKHSKTYQHQKSMSTFKLEETDDCKEKIFTNNGVTVRAKLVKSEDRSRITITKIEDNDTIPPNIETIYVPSEQRNGNSTAVTSNNPKINSSPRISNLNNKPKWSVPKEMLLLKKRKMELENENLTLQNEGQMLKNRRLQLEILKIEKELGYHDNPQINTVEQEQSIHNEEGVQVEYL